MDAIEDRHRLGRHGTDVPSIQAVQDAVSRLVGKQWFGWTTSDKQDLAQLVMVKYFKAFGRDRLPDDENGEPEVPVSWLITVIRNAGVDLHRQLVARPADPVDFGGSEGPGLERLALLVDPQPTAATDVANKLDVQSILQPALSALANLYPMDAKLIVWRYLEDRDIDTIAAIRGSSAEATKKAIQRAVRRMRELIHLNFTPYSS